MLSRSQQKLVEDNIQLVFFVIHKHKFNIEDVDIGWIGLCNAARLYKPESGLSFTTYAHKAILNEFLKEQRHNNTKGRQATLLSLDEVVYSDGNDEIKLEDCLPDSIDTASSAIIAEFFDKYCSYLATLNPKQYNIMGLWLQNKKQRDIATEVGYTQAQISRIINNVNRKFIKKYYPNISYLDLEEDLRRWQKK